ncbi:hypothetical protein Nmel_018792, partial [Mimus melanotis]
MKFSSLPKFPFNSTLSKRILSQRVRRWFDVMQVEKDCLVLVDILLGMHLAKFPASFIHQPGEFEPAEIPSTAHPVLPCETLGQNANLPSVTASFQEKSFWFASSGQCGRQCCLGSPGPSTAGAEVVSRLGFGLWAPCLCC